ncbi:uncharacterized protein N7477_009149 [Penicillium maclennaniae]|uniref:uncharacterized protein n=1 Tax=Penicillium maclennaniae TaxID=1343394 RepID=UPI0025411D04|nr:uncharacterized protein N7477_009149 [Penicillium maclennaniae]KAJ5661533.1 hypothetical protein N7477_009149 [Penicillium maclennaniae]
MSALCYDPEFAQLAGESLTDHRDVIPVGDIKSRRDRIAQFIEKSQSQELPKDIKQQVHYSPSSDGHPVAIYHFTKTGTSSGPGPAIVHIHGGGYTCLTAAAMTPTLTSYVSITGVPILSIDYRLSPEHPIDPHRIAIMGESAGGGLTAALAILARDRELSPPLAKQILMYPMMDDRTETDHTGGLAVFATEDVITGWAAYLGDLYKTDKIPPYAAAVKLEDVRGLPPLYFDCGQLDMFIHEGSTYAQKFIMANIPVEMHVYQGVPHAFQRFAPTSKVAQRALANRVAAMLSF